MFFVVGTFPVLESEKKAYLLLGRNGLFGNGENLIRLISSYPFFQYVWIGPKSDKVEFQHQLNGSHGAALRSAEHVNNGTGDSSSKRDCEKEQKFVLLVGCA